jgi:uncharacterized membrane protein
MMIWRRIGRLIIVPSVILVKIIFLSRRAYWIIGAPYVLKGFGLAILLAFIGHYLEKDKLLNKINN